MRRKFPAITRRSETLSAIQIAFAATMPTQPTRKNGDPVSRSMSSWPHPDNKKPATRTKTVRRNGIQ